MPPRKTRPLNRHVTVYQQLAIGAANADGGFDEEPAVYWQGWCRAWPLKGTEPKAMEHQQAIVEWTVQTRFCVATAAITATMWIILPGGERLNITTVYDPDGRRRWIEIRARQVA